MGEIEGKKGRGRPRGVNTIGINYKMPKDLYDALPKTKGFKRTQYINDAVRARMEAEGLIEPKKKIDKSK